jgi:hypothetical protein
VQRSALTRVKEELPTPAVANANSPLLSFDRPTLRRYARRDRSSELWRLSHAEVPIAADDDLETD